MDLLMHRYWEEQILMTLQVYCQPDNLFKKRGGISLHTFLINLGFMLQTYELLNTYLSEYQYLNPLF